MLAAQINEPALAKRHLPEPRYAGVFGSFGNKDLPTYVGLLIMKLSYMIEIFSFQHARCLLYLNIMALISHDVADYPDNGAAVP